ncbi:hypothetical protein LC593_21685 [Nostoc sp. CHAB 5844]|nr:hypothetical protein [Nostoc sp. CHAB 5844]
MPLFLSLCRASEGVGKADSHATANPKGGSKRCSNWRCLTTVLSPQRTANAPTLKIATLTPRRCLPNALASLRLCGSLRQALARLR